MLRVRNTAGVFVLALAGLTACGGEEAMGRVAMGEPVPAYGAPTLAGDTLSLTELEGAPVLLNLWATWCGPCREEMPDLQEIQDEFAGEGLRVIGVSIDQAYASGDIRSFLDEHAITFTILHDAEGRVTRVFRTVGVPETFLIGADGTLVARWFGQIDPAAVRGTIREVI